MTPDRLRQIEELYHSARESGTGERAALLSQLDPELRYEVESLLACQDENLPSLDVRALSSLECGARLGPYEIESKLGEGGMGEVFRAIDTRLARSVAIKIVDQEFSARFEREARTISSLNHPHICTLYDVGPNYLVMELLEGETIAARLKGGPLPVADTLSYAAQIAAALADAHAHGVVHRDLKPGNIMLTKSGAKVLDFGLATRAGDDTLTGSYLMMGTPGYLAPEQRDGKLADARTDIYSFGCVLYEMLTGKRIGPQRKRIPLRKLESIVTRCLHEDPARRWQSAAEIERELKLPTPARLWPAVSATAVALTFLGAASFYFYRAPKLTPKDSLVLGEFENKTGDAVFDQTLRHGLTLQLEQSPFLTLVSEQRVQQLLRLMSRPAGTRLSPDIAREICERAGGTAVLEGSITGLGDQYVLWLRASNCLTGTVIEQAQTQAARKEEVLNALSRIVIEMRTRLGESLTTIEEHSTPLEQATTSSLEALKAYSAGRSALFTRGGPAAIIHFQRAVAIDPQFAMAYGDLSITYWNLGQTDLAADYTRKAYALRDHVSDHERLWILFLYDRQVTGNLPRELQTIESWVQTYPRDWQAWAVMGGWGTMGTGQYEKGIQAGLEALRLNPETSYPYTVAQHYLLLDRFTEAAAILRKASEHKVEIPEMLVTRYYLAFFKGDEAAMDREVGRATEEHAEDWMALNQALVLARSGQMRRARTSWQRAVALAQQAGNRERAAIYAAAQAVCEAHFGNRVAARERAQAALQIAKGRDVEYAAAFALALSGDFAGSQKLAADLGKRFPEDTPVQFEYLPTLGALGALAHRAPLDAIERLQRAIPYDLAMPGTAFFARFGGLYPAYVRGMAYLEMRKGREAAAEFQKVVDHRGVVFADPIGALAHLQLGRALVLSGEKDKAKKAYQDFLTLWNDADSELPILKQVKSEYAKLL